MEELVEFLAESRIVGSDGGQHPGMVERRIQRLFEFPDPVMIHPNRAGIQVLTGQRLLLQRIKAPQQLNVFLGQRRRSVSARISIKAISKGESGSEPSSP